MRLKYFIMILSVSLMISCGNKEETISINKDVDESVQISPAKNSSNVCSKEWFETIEKKYQISNKEGHGGFDIASADWMFAVEARLGIKEGEAPRVSVPKWCDYIHKKMN